jgi:hypothetical protein
MEAAKKDLPVKKIPGPEAREFTVDFHQFFEE